MPRNCKMLIVIGLMALTILIVGGCPQTATTGGIHVMFADHPDITDEMVYWRGQHIGTIAEIKTGYSTITKVTVRLDSQFQKQAGHNWAFYVDRGRLQADRISISGKTVAAGDPVCGFSSKASLNWFKVKTLLKDRVANAMRRADNLQRRFG